jgi:hypothetical protein
MPQAEHRGPHIPHVTLNTDGQRHPRENALALITIALGLVAVACALWEDLHQVGSFVGAAGVVAGLWAQLVSATTGERWLIVVGLGAAALGFGLNMANGGFL